MIMNDDRIQPLLTKVHLRKTVARIQPGEKVYYKAHDDQVQKGTVRRVLPFIILLTNGATMTHFEYWQLNQSG